MAPPTSSEPACPDDELTRLYGIEFEHRGCKPLREADNAVLIGQRDAAIAQRDAALAGELGVQSSYQEWRVTGQPDGDIEPYEFIFSPVATPQLLDPQAAARAQQARLEALGVAWATGPDPHCRVVLHTGWQPVGPA